VSSAAETCRPYGAGRPRVASSINMSRLQRSAREAALNSGATRFISLPPGETDAKAPVRANRVAFEFSLITLTLILSQRERKQTQTVRHTLSLPLGETDPA